MWASISLTCGKERLNFNNKKNRNSFLSNFNAMAWNLDLILFYFIFSIKLLCEFSSVRELQNSALGALIARMLYSMKRALIQLGY